MSRTNKTKTESKLHSCFLNYCKQVHQIPKKNPIPEIEKQCFLTANKIFLPLNEIAQYKKFQCFNCNGEFSNIKWLTYSNCFCLQTALCENCFLLVV